MDTNISHNFPLSQKKSKLQTKSLKVSAVGGNVYTLERYLKGRCHNMEKSKGDKTSP